MFSYFLALACIIIALQDHSSDGQPTISLQLLQPDSDQVCNGNKIILSCTVIAVQQFAPFLIWEQIGANPYRVYYRKGVPTAAPLGDFATTAVFSNNNYTIKSNATINNASLLHHNKSISCYTPGAHFITKYIKIAGAETPPSGLNITILSTTPLLLSLVWQPPPNAVNCSTVNYAVNITNSSSITQQIFSSFNSLVLTNLSYEENYLFAVAVVDSAGQYGPWSESLVVTLNDQPTSIPNQPLSLHITTNVQDVSSIVISSIAFTNHFSLLKAIVRKTPSMSQNSNPTKGYILSSCCLTSFFYKLHSHAVSPDRIAYELIIGATSGVLVVSIASSIIISTFIFCIRKKHRCHKKTISSDKVVYDVPFFKNEADKIPTFQPGPGDIALCQNKAYEQTFNIHMH